MTQQNRRWTPDTEMRRGFVLRIEDEMVLDKTGRSWEEWGRVLDDWYISGRDFSAAAKFLRNEYEISTWWANTIAARYRWENGLAE